MLLPTKLLVGLAIILAVLALFAPLHLLLIARYPLVVYQGRWSLAGVRFNPPDLILVFFVLAYFLRGRRAIGAERQSFPYLLPWLVLGLLLSTSYLAAPSSQEHLTDLARIGYQLYRYCWKGILFFPLALLLLDSGVKTKRALFAVVLAGDLLGLQATMEGYALGGRASGPFDTPNELGACLVGPLVLSLIGFFAPQIRYRLFWIASAALIARGLLFTGSRGAVVAVAAGAAFCAGWLLTRTEGRARLGRVVPAALLAAALAFWIKPDLLDRPALRRAMTAWEGMNSQTMQWRVSQRWPRFVELIGENPWLGVGTPVDVELAQLGGAPTPHNGYLAIAVANGIPAGLLYLLMAFLAIKNGLSLFVHSTDSWQSTFGLVLAASMIGILVHNVVDSTIRLSFVRDLFWLICALTARQALALRAKRREVPQSRTTRALVSRMARSA